MEFNHEIYGVCKTADIVQRQIEEFQRAIQKLDGEPMAVWKSTTVKAGAKSGILVEPVLNDDQVDNSKYLFVEWLADCVIKAVNEAMGIDPLSSLPPQTSPKESKE
jgi:hypothetical protein